jgi:hypothetical protein
MALDASGDMGCTAFGDHPCAPITWSYGRGDSIENELASQFTCKLHPEKLIDVFRYALNTQNYVVKG